MSEIPLRGDRAARDSLNYPELHASDLEENSPKQHLPKSPTAGDLAVYDGAKWVKIAKTGIPLDDWGEAEDNTDLDATDGHHGLLPKLSGDSDEVLHGDGTWAEGGGGSGDMLKATYDTNDDGTVDSADYATEAGDSDTLDGSHAGDFATVSHAHGEFAAMQEPTGFVSRSTSTIGFTDGSREFAISPTGASFDIYSAGTKYTKAATTKVITDTVGMHYIYFDTSGVIQSSTSPWDINSGNIPIATVYWNGTNGILMDERHGVQMDGQTHEYLHETRGSSFASGMAGTFAANGSSITIEQGEWYDEDIEHTFAQQTTCRIFYLDGSTWKWTSAQAAYYHALGTPLVPQYNNSGALADVGSSKYTMSWVYATNHSTTPIAVIMGQAQYNTLAQAEAAGVPTLASLPASEMVLLYKIVWQRDGTIIAWKSTADYRRSNGGPVSNYVAVDHGSLAGLGDLDHPASAIRVDTTNFDGNLSAADDDLQKALETLDDMVGGGGGDAADITYTPAVLADWDSDADPGNVDDGLDQLAERVTDLEDTPPGSPDASDVTYTPAVNADWDSDTDPGNVDNALDQLSERVDDLEGASGHAAVTLDTQADDILKLTVQEIGLQTQTANYVLAGPTSGGVDEPTFRALVASDIPNVAGKDTTAIHDNESAEISALTEKSTPVAADLVLIEDSAASNAKKKVQVTNLLLPHFLYSKWDPDCPPAAPSAYDDEFSDGSFNAVLWTEYDRGSLISPAEGDLGAYFGFTGDGSAIKSAGIYQSIPAGDFTIDTKVFLCGYHGTYNYGAGIALLEADSDAGDFHIIYLQKYNGANTLGVHKYSAWNTYASSYNTSTPDNNVVTTSYFRIRRNATTYYFEYSSNGITYTLAYTGTLTPTPTLMALVMINKQTTLNTAIFRFFRYQASDVGRPYPCYGKKVSVYG